MTTNQLLARANNETNNEKMLYCEKRVNETKRKETCCEEITYQCLDVEEEHSDDPMTRTIKLEEVHQGILPKENRLNTRKHEFENWILTTEAAKEPFNQRRRWPINSTAASGTSVSAFEGFT